MIQAATSAALSPLPSLRIMAITVTRLLFQPHPLHSQGDKIMYNILIVDDEYLARNMLHFLMDWNQYDFQIIGEAASAEEAILFLQSNPVDLVFADVYMPDMDGIALAGYIHTNYPKTKVVMFSNYSDFNYVKGAFSANVVDYILKHTITEESMVKLLQHIREKHLIHSEGTGILPAAEQEAAYRARVKQTLLEESSDYQPENVMIAAMGIHNPSLSLQLYSAPELDMLYQNFENTIAKIIADIKGFVIFRDGNNIILYLPFAPDQTQVEIMHLVSEYIRQINSAIYKFFNFDLLWGISVLSTPEYSVRQCYTEACAMLASNPSKGQKLPFSQDDAPINRLSINMEKSLLSAISDLNLPKVNQCLEQIFSTITPADKIDILLNDLTSIAAKFYNEFGIPVQETLTLPAAGRSPRKYLEWAQQLFSHIINTRLNADSVHYQSGYAHSAMDYIAQNYHNEELSLGEIARHIGISEQHLSKVFKKETGKNLSAYLAEYRVERAKELLRQNTTNLKWVHSKVGFGDNSYFCTVFKKYAGCSPREYQKLHLK